MCGASDICATQRSLTLTLSRQRERELEGEGIGKEEWKVRESVFNWASSVDGFVLADRAGPAIHLSGRSLGRRLGRGLGLRGLP